MEGLFCLRELLQEGNYTCASWIWKMLIFQFRRISQKGTMFGFMVRESLWVCLLMFWLGTSSQNFHKIAENTNACTEEDKYSNSNILGRYSYNGSYDGWKSHVQRHCNLPPATFRFCFNLEKLILNPVQEIEFLGVTINSLKMCLSLPQEVLKIKSQCQDIHSKGHATVHELTELLGFLPQQFRKLSAQINFEYLQQQQIKALRETQKLSSNCIPLQQFKGRTSVMDPKSPDFQWVLSYSVSKYFDNMDGCIQGREAGEQSVREFQ